MAGSGGAPFGGTGGSKHTIGKDSGGGHVTQAMKEHRGGALDGNTEGSTSMAPKGQAREREWRRSTVGAGQDMSKGKDFQGGAVTTTKAGGRKG